MSDKKQNVVTIDGPSGVGKSTVSKKVAAGIGFTYLDTGAMYRAVGLYFKRFSVEIDNEKDISAALKSLDLQLIPAKDEQSDVGVVINGQKVTDLIRTPEMAMIASRVSAVPLVRDVLTQIQRKLGEKGGVVAEGRDTGTVVFPRAAYKFFLDATPEIRARRRFEQLAERGVATTLSEVLALTLERDYNDRNRPVAPLKKANDAVCIDTTEISLEDVVSRILGIITSKT
jgi:cytidylate kinase